MEHTHNPDNRTNNVEVMKTKINNTRHNTEIADEIIRKTKDDEEKINSILKNKKRKEAINHLSQEIKNSELDKQ